MLPVRYHPKAEKYFKKIKDKNLKKAFENAINKIRQNPKIGEIKKDDLAGIFGYDVYYAGTNYEIAYTIEIIDDETVLVLLAGTRENFYNELKRFLF